MAASLLAKVVNLASAVGKIAASLPG